MTNSPVAYSGSGYETLNARRAVIGWAWRLFRLEWRQHVLVILLLAVAQATTIVSTAVAFNAPTSPQATFGSAESLLSVPGSDRNLAADLEAIRQRIASTDSPANGGAADIIERKTIDVPGAVATVELRAQDPHGRYGQPTLSLVTGRLPTHGGEVAPTGAVAKLFNLHIGDTWQADGRAWRVTGLVENPANLRDQFALVTPGQIIDPTEVTILYDPGRCTTLACAQVRQQPFPGGAHATSRPQGPQRVDQSTIPLMLAVLGHIFIALVAVAGFTVIARRRLRALGMLAAVGATDRQIRLVTTANGALVGLAGTIAGAAVGLASWFLYAPRLQTTVAHVIDPMHLPWRVLATAGALGVLASLLAAWGPARSSTRVPIVAALSGRPSAARLSPWVIIVGTIGVAVGLWCLASSGGWSALGINGPNGGWSSAAAAVGQGHVAGQGRPLIIGGLVTVIVGALLFAPAVVAVPAAVARWSALPVPVQLSLRDLGRYRARAGAAVAAVSFASLLAALTCILVTASYADPLSFVGPNLAANQLIVYEPHTLGRGAELNSPGEPSAPAQQAGLQATVDQLASAIHARFAIPLYSAGRAAKFVDPDAPDQTNQRATLWHAVSVGTVQREEALLDDNANYAGPLYVATPELFNALGIALNRIDPGADILTSRTGLSSVPHLELLGQGAIVTHMNPPGHEVSETHLCPPGSCLAHPKIQTVTQLPTGTSAPNTLITEHALHQLGQDLVPDGFFVQTPRPLTATQINAARTIAFHADTRIEVSSGQPTLTQIRNRATAVTITLALIVLAIAVTLLRSETGSDLRTLTANGATTFVRRALTATTAAAIAVVGAALGTATAYLAVAAWAHARLSITLRPVPVADLTALLVGLPLAAAICGWLLGGREPRAISRQPLV